MRKLIQKMIHNLFKDTKFTPVWLGLELRPLYTNCLSWPARAQALGAFTQLSAPLTSTFPSHGRTKFRAPPHTERIQDEGQRSEGSSVPSGEAMDRGVKGPWRGSRKMSEKSEKTSKSPRTWESLFALSPVQCTFAPCLQKCQYFRVYLGGKGGSQHLRSTSCTSRPQ